VIGMRIDLLYLRYFTKGIYLKNEEVKKKIRILWKYLDNKVISNPLKKYTNLTNILEPRNKADLMRAYIFFEMAGRVCNNKTEWIFLEREIRLHIKEYLYEISRNNNE
jgi:hypothetical protein